MKWIRRILYAAVVIMAVMVGARFWVMHDAMNNVADPRLGQFIGPADAGRVVVEFMDYRCYACRLTAPNVDEFHRLNPDVKIVFRHLPVMGKISTKEARIALAAGKNGKFEEMHKLLISREDPVEDSEIDLLARAVDLDPEKLRKDMDGLDVTGEILTAVSAAEALRIRGTPSFLINGTLYTSTMKIPTAEDISRVLANGPAGEGKR